MAAEPGQTPPGSSKPRTSHSAPDGTPAPGPDLCAGPGALAQASGETHAASPLPGVVFPEETPGAARSRPNLGTVQARLEQSCARLRCSGANLLSSSSVSLGRKIKAMARSGLLLRKCPSLHLREAQRLQTPVLVDHGCRMPKRRALTTADVFFCPGELRAVPGHKPNT